MSAWEPTTYPPGSLGRWGRADLYARDVAEPQAGPSPAQVLAAGGGLTVAEVSYDGGLSEYEWSTGDLVDPYGDHDPYHQVAAEQVRALEETVWSVLVYDPEDYDEPVQVRSLSEQGVSHLLAGGWTQALVDHQEITGWLVAAEATIASGGAAQAVVGADRHEVAAHLLSAALNPALEAPITIWRRGRGR